MEITMTSSQSIKSIINSGKPGDDRSISNPENKDYNLLLVNLLKNKKQFSKYEKFAKKLLLRVTRNEFARFITSEDILQNIFTRLIDNKYHWNSEKCSFDKFMCLRIRTELENLVKHESNFIPVDINSFKSNQESDYNEDTENDKRLTREDFIIEPDLTSPDKKEDEFDMTDLMEMALDYFHDSEIEFFVLEEILQNKKPKEIAKSLGLTTREVRNATLRIRRKLIRWCQKKNHKELLKILLSPVKKNNRKGNHRHDKIK